MHFDITPQENQVKKRLYLKELSNIALWFFIISFLPIILYFLFHFNLLSSSSKWNTDLEQPVAIVVSDAGTGTAFLVGETRLLSAKHVFEGMDIGQTVQLSFEKADPVIITEAVIIWYDQNEYDEPESLLHDIAVLELTNPIDLPEDFPRMNLGVSEGVTTRDEVNLIGYPGGMYSITEGTISNDEIKGLDLFQIDAGAWPGSSGGPLVLTDTEEVIGILIAGFQEEFQGINMANKIDNILNELDKNSIDIYN